MLKHLRTTEDFEQKNLLQKGFTLVELLVVIVILGILAAVVVFAVGGATNNAQSSSCKAEESTIAAAVEAYRANPINAAYPTALSQMVKATAADPSNVYLRSLPTLYKIKTGSTDGTLDVTTAGGTKGCTVTP